MPLSIDAELEQKPSHCTCPVLGRSTDDFKQHQTSYSIADVLSMPCSANSQRMQANSWTALANAF